MVELDVLALVVAGMAIGTVARPALSAPNIILRSPVDVVGDDQIKPAVLVVIEPAGARRPLAFIGEARFRGHVSEGTVPVVVIQNRAAISGHKQIRVSIVVEVADRNALAIVT